MNNFLDKMEHQLAVSTAEKNSVLYSAFILMIALAYGGILAMLPLELFNDRGNYSNYLKYSHEIWDINWQAGFKVLFSNEPLWLFINVHLSDWMSGPNALRFLIFFPAMSVAYTVLRVNAKYFFYLILILIFPPILKNHVIHLRQGAGIALFLAGWFSRNTGIRRSLILMAPFVHSSFFFIWGLMVLAKLGQYIQLSPALRVSSFIAAGLAFDFIFPHLVSFSGARQALEYEATFSGEQGMLIGLGFLFWTMILVALLLEGGAFIRRFTFEIGTIVFYLMTHIFFYMLARVFEGTMVLLLMACIQLTGWRRVFVFFMLFLLMSVEYWGQFHHIRSWVVL